MSHETNPERIRTALKGLIATHGEGCDSGPACPAVVEGVAALGVVSAIKEASIEQYIARQWEWSKRTFGPGRRTLGIIDHITKELREVAAKPDDLSEWIDVAILAMDGYWRHGGTPEQFMRDMQSKQYKNFARAWPTPTSEDIATEHDRTLEGRQ